MIIFFVAGFRVRGFLVLVEIFAKNWRWWVGEYTNFGSGLDSQLVMGLGAEQIVRILD